MTTPSLTLASLDAIDRDSVHYFEYRDIPFLYVVPSMQRIELRAETAHVVRQLLKGKGKTIRIAPGKFAVEDLLAAYERLKGLSEEVRSSLDEVRQERSQSVQEEVDDLEHPKRVQQNSRVGGAVRRAALPAMRRATSPSASSASAPAKS